MLQHPNISLAAYSRFFLVFFWGVAAVAFAFVTTIRTLIGKTTLKRFRSKLFKTLRLIAWVLKVRFFFKRKHFDVRKRAVNNFLNRKTPQNMNRGMRSACSCYWVASKRYFFVVAGTRAAAWHSRTRSTALKPPQHQNLWSKTLDTGKKSTRASAKLSHIKGYGEFSVSSRKTAVHFSCWESRD